jgi:crotonobetainyl-CoA:carnitine CoA-transferase CaiB-like acyl-CoA transferase
MIVEVEQPGCPAPVTIAGIPIRMTETPGSVRRRAPPLGEDSGDILRGLGCEENEIAAWKQMGVVA